MASVANKEDVMVGHCGDCGKLDRVDKFERIAGQLFCCSKVNLNISIKATLFSLEGWPTINILTWIRQFTTH